MTILGTVAVNELYTVQHLFVKELYTVWFFQLPTCFSTDLVSQCSIQTITIAMHLSDGNTKIINKMNS
jgi:hypothetical protein